MSGAIQSLLDVLRRELRARGEDDAVGEEWSFDLCDAARLADGAPRRVGLLVHRLELDPGARGQAPAPGQGLAVDLRLLLLVWAGDPLSELTVLGRCAEVLEQRAVLTGDDLNPAWGWAPGAMLRISPDTLSPDQLAQIWQSLQVPLRPTLAYVLRGIRLRRTEELAAPVAAVLSASTPSSRPS